MNDRIPLRGLLDRRWLVAEVDGPDRLLCRERVGVLQLVLGWIMLVLGLALMGVFGCAVVQRAPPLAVVCSFLAGALNIVSGAAWAFPRKGFLLDAGVRRMTAWGLRRFRRRSKTFDFALFCGVEVRPCSLRESVFRVALVSRDGELLLALPSRQEDAVKLGEQVAGLLSAPLAVEFGPVSEDEATARFVTDLVAPKLLDVDE